MEAVTAQRAESVQKAMRSTFDLYRRTHLAHFNVRGPWFPQLHALFDDQYNELWQALDAIGERLRALGATVDGGVFGGGHAPEGVDAVEAVRDLARGHRQASKDWAALARTCGEQDDVATEDLCVERMRAHDQHAWMLEAVLEGGR